MGARLAEESPAEADFVMPIPDSGNYAALGFAERLGLPFEMGMIRNHYVGRTFIQPSQSVRDFGVKIKLNPVRDLLKGNGSWSSKIRSFAELPAGQESRLCGTPA